MIPPLETPRLWMRPLDLADADQVQQIFPQWEIVRFLNAVVPWPYPPDGALTYLRDRALPAMDRGDEWHWTLRRKAQPDAVIGAIALIRGENENRGFWIAPPYRGQGLMTEAVAAVNDYWFDELGFKTLRAPKAVANAASRRISEKTGMRMVALEERDLVSGRLPSEVWEITAEEWGAIRARFRSQSAAASGI
ncbi:MAG TPA: GNAT family N-acetyltransferase [Acidobacteriaceae bacterium]|nr:GNAT family N-acetyltransferase [Acidobacteriaceae bacterium]